MQEQSFNEPLPQQSANNIPPRQDPPMKPFFPTGKKELAFCLLITVSALMLCNFILWGGFHLGYAIASFAVIFISAGYLLLSGCKLGPYSGALLLLSLVISAGFARSNDGFVKFVMVCFQIVAVNLGLCLLAGQERRNAGGISSLADVFRCLFMLGLGKLEPAFQGIRLAFKRSGTAGQKSGAVLVGLVIALPLVAILIPLLMSADAAFEGLLDLLPEFDFAQVVITLILGAMLAVPLYVRGAALRHSPKHPPAAAMTYKGLHVFTVNTVLGAVCLVYLVYLLSQLAYFVSGFAGILPEGFTAAEYARRGFFEMAAICAINLSVIAIAVAVTGKKPAPMSTRVLCLFIGLITLFLVCTASSKMFVYIGSFGLTRLRVLTQAIMLWVGLVTALVCVWLFIAKMPYMKVSVIAALVIGGCLLWADVDTQVAKYNVESYLSGRMEQVDVSHLGTLSDGALPYLQKLVEKADAETAEKAKDVLTRKAEYYYLPYIPHYEDFRGWNLASAEAEKILEAYKPAEGQGEAVEAEDWYD